MRQQVQNMDILGPKNDSTLPEFFDELQKQMQNAGVKLPPSGAANPAQSSFKRGGIDLTAGKTPLQILNAGQGIHFSLDPAMLARLQGAQGFEPVVVTIKPLEDLQKFLNASL